MSFHRLSSALSASVSPAEKTSVSHDATSADLNSNRSLNGGSLPRVAILLFERSGRPLSHSETGFRNPQRRCFAGPVLAGIQVATKRIERLILASGGDHRFDSRCDRGVHLSVSLDRRIWLHQSRVAAGSLWTKSLWPHAVRSSELAERSDAARALDLQSQPLRLFVYVAGARPGLPRRRQLVVHAFPLQAG